MDLHDEFREKGVWLPGDICPDNCVAIATRVAIEFAEWSVITQAFGLYGYEHSFELFKKEKGY